MPGSPVPKASGGTVSVGRLTAPLPAAPFIMTPASGAANVEIEIDFGAEDTITT